MKWWTSGLGLGLCCCLAACAVVEFGVGGAGGAGAGAPSSGGGGDAPVAGGFGGSADGGSPSVTSTTTDMGGSSVTNMGGSPPLPVLSDTGLVARYYLDEAASGTPDGAMAMDAAPAPLNLPITWGVGDAFRYAEIDNQRGLESTTAGLDARASVTGMSATKVGTALSGSQTGTLEVVLEVSGVHMSNSRFIHIGTGDESGRFSLSAGSLDEVNFFWRSSSIFPTDYLAGHWPVTFTPGERIVLHAVLDSGQAAEIDRARLYRNGVLVTGNDTKNPVQIGQTLSFVDSDAFVLGNREIGVRTFDGTLFYAAVYQSALTSAEVINNASVLLASDDTPE